MRSLLMTGLVSLALVGAAHAQSASELFPMQTGNSWTYQDSRNGGTRTITTRFARDISGGQQAYLEGFQGDKWWWFSHVSGRAYVWNPTAQTSTLAFDLGVGNGNSFTVDFPEGPGCMNRTGWEVETGVTHQSQVGVFRNCVKIRLTQPVCADAGTTQMIFAPSVGLLEWTTTSLLGGTTHRLTQARVNGRDYRASSGFTGGVTTSLALDKFTYTLRMPHPLTPVMPMPDQLKAKLVIKNETTETIEFNVGGQGSEWLIKNAAGTIVYRASEGLAFPAVMRRFNLLPTESIDFELDIPLSNNITGQSQGTALRAGNYTLEGISFARPRMKACGSFKIVEFQP